MSTIQHKLRTLRDSQAGMVSIMTTMVLMIVISLTVLGFAQLSRRNQRETLDRQLSVQAFYAAESGVNDVRELIINQLAAGNTIPEKISCTDLGSGGFYGALNPTIDAAKNVRYTCLLVDPSPETLRYSDVGTTSVVVPVISSGNPVSEIRLTWQPKVTGSNPLSGCPTTTTNIFTPVSGWGCGYGVLRFDLVPATGTFTADSLRTSTMTLFGVPFSTGGVSSVPYTADTANDNRRGITCTATECSLRITGLTQTHYYMRISSIYRDAALQVSAVDGGGTNVELQGAQAVVDSTGKAQDVLRRIQVHMPLRASSKNQLSDYAIQSTDAICKRFSIMEGFFANDVTGVTSSNRLCQP